MQENARIWCVSLKHKRNKIAWVEQNGTAPDNLKLREYLTF